MDRFMRFLFVFSVTYLILIWIMPVPENNKASIVFKATEEDYTVGDLVTVNIQNNSNSPAVFKSKCPNYYFGVERNIDGAKENLTELFTLSSCEDLVVDEGEKKEISIGDDNYHVFSKIGSYKLIAVTEDEKEYEASFNVVEPGFFSTLWNAFIYKPIYNLLIVLIKHGPGMSLGFGIIILTILIKLALMVPNHKALKNQKLMQNLQPELNKIKDKYKGDQQKIAMETMNLWKKHKTNPMGSCLPILVQFPVLIAIFFIIKDGLTQNSSIYLYSFLSDFDYSGIDTLFLGVLDLKIPNIYVLPLMVGGLQYLQMHLSFKSQPTPAKGGNPMQEQMQSMTKMMKYVLPIMIVIFTATMPAAIGLYWGISTLFSVFQQVFINKSDSGDSQKKGKGKKYEDVEIVENSSKKKDGITVIKA